MTEDEHFQLAVRHLGTSAALAEELAKQRKWDEANYRLLQGISHGLMQTLLEIGEAKLNSSAANVLAAERHLPVVRALGTLTDLDALIDEDEEERTPNA